MFDVPNRILFSLVLSVVLVACGGDSENEDPVNENDVGVLPDAGFDDASNGSDASEPDAAPPTVGWSIGDVASSEVVAIASDGGVVWFLTAGVIHRVEGTKYETFEIPEVDFPIDIDANQGRVSAVGLDDGGLAWVVQQVGDAWAPTPIPGGLCPGGPPCADASAAEPGGVDVGPDSVTRVAVRGGYLEKTGTEWAPNTFAGGEESRFEGIEFRGSGVAWLFGDTQSLHRDDREQWTSLPPDVLTPVADSADDSAVFTFKDSQVGRYEVGEFGFWALGTEVSFSVVEAVSEDVAIVAGNEGALQIVSVPAMSNGLEMNLVAEPVEVDSMQADYTAMHVVAEDELWLGTSDGRVIRYGLGMIDGWQATTGDELSLDPGTTPDPDPDPDPDPVEETLVRFVGIGQGSYVCDGQQSITSTLGERGGANAGYEVWNPGTYNLEEEFPSAGGCRGLGLDDFTLRLSEGDVKTVVIGANISFGASILTDDLSAPSQGEARVRFWGRDRVGTGDLTDVEYCIDGAPLAGSSRPSTGYLPYAAGEIEVDVRIADGACGGELRDTFSISASAGQVRSVFLSPGDELGPMRDISDVYIIDCLDSMDGEPTKPSTCQTTYASPAP